MKEQTSMRTYAIVTQQWNPEPTAVGTVQSISANLVRLASGLGSFTAGMEVKAKAGDGRLRCGTATVKAVSDDFVELDDPWQISGLCHGDVLIEWVVREMTIGVEVRAGHDGVPTRVLAVIAGMRRGPSDDTEAAMYIAHAAFAGYPCRWFVEVGRANDHRHRVRVESD